MNYSLSSQPQQVRSKKRVARILVAAKTLFIAHGYDTVSMKAIAVAAEVPVGTIYQFFPSKTALLVAVSNEYLEATKTFHERITTHAPATLSTYFQQLLGAMESYYKEHGALEQIFMASTDTAVHAVANDVHTQTMSYLQRAVGAYVTIDEDRLAAYCQVSAEIVKPILLQVLRLPQDKQHLLNTALHALDMLWKPHERSMPKSR